MYKAGDAPNKGWSPDRARLDRSSFVPLYYQLQELLKEAIESGVWLPDDLLPSEPELAESFGISRVVVRQALAILEDDRQVVRIQGKGTYVARPKLDYRAGGLARLLESTRSDDITVQVLDKRADTVEESISHRLGLNREEQVIRITTLLSLRRAHLAIAYSFFNRDDVGWLLDAAHVGRNLSPTLVLADYDVRLAHSQVVIETSQCGQFEAERFGIPVRSAVFLVLANEYRLAEHGQVRPFEVARIEYRGDIVQFRLEVAPGGSMNELAAIWGVKQGRASSGTPREIPIT
jgi:GntR family transcriptional regulator